jgi:hypothetical protein
VPCFIARKLFTSAVKTDPSEPAIGSLDVRSCSARNLNPEILFCLFRHGRFLHWSELQTEIVHGMNPSLYFCGSKYARTDVGEDGIRFLKQAYRLADQKMDACQLREGLFTCFDLPLM